MATKTYASAARARNCLPAEWKSALANRKGSLVVAVAIDGGRFLPLIFTGVNVENPHAHSPEQFAINLNHFGFNAIPGVASIGMREMHGVVR